MSIIDKIGGTITTKSQDLTKKAKDMAETVKLNGQISEIENKLKDCYAQLGQMTYRSGLEFPEEFRPYFENIQNLETEKDKYNLEVMKLKKLRTCPNCGMQVPAEALFCNGCGSKLEQLIINETPSVRFCTECGSQISQETVFCPNCGKKTN